MARASFGVAGAVTAGLALLPVLFFDRFEVLVQDLTGIDGGIRVFLLVLVAFALAWVIGASILARWSPHPLREGVVAGAAVAFVMGLVLVLTSRQWGTWTILAVLWPLFGGLALACGAAAGAAAARVRRAPARP